MTLFFARMAGWITATHSMSSFHTFRKVNVFRKMMSSAVSRCLHFMIHRTPQKHHCILLSNQVSRFVCIKMMHKPERNIFNIIGLRSHIICFDSCLDHATKTQRLYIVKLLKSTRSHDAFQHSLVFF